MTNTLAAALNEVIAHTDLAARLAVDPVQWPRRYRSADDREVAAWLSSTLAFGRAEGFGAVLAALFSYADTRGGPAALCDEMTAADREAVGNLSWRWTRGSDLVQAAVAVGRVRREASSLEAVAGGGSAASALSRLVAALVSATGNPVNALPHGLRALWPSPVDGSACKRGLLFLRWVVRPEDGVDLGLWTSLTTRDLLVPVDTHLGRVARFLGFTKRKVNDWRTAEEITDALRQIDPVDPVRFDFALTHLGMSGDCRGYRVAHICPSCPLEPWCQA